MTTTEQPRTGTTLITQNAIEQFLYREARYLDDREFEKWLECYSDDVVYWIPCWDDADRLVEDPQRDISLIYYENKAGWRIGSFASAPSAPARRRCPSHAPVTTSATSR
jgi:Small subunit of phenylpropionate dioxygenase